jgi:hypothetical protein
MVLDEKGTVMHVKTQLLINVTREQRTSSERLIEGYHVLFS